MARPNHLRTLAFRLAPGTSGLRRRFFTLQVPAGWKEALRRMEATARGREYERTTVPYSGLNRVVRALVPDLVHISASAWKAGERPWLYAREPLDAASLFLLVRAWLEQAMGHVAEARRDEVLGVIRSTDLQWWEQTIDVSAWQTVPNGTARPEFPDSFRILPDLLAARLSRPGVTLSAGSEPLRFLRAPVSPGDSGAELVSWPPRLHSDGHGRRWGYSVVMTLTVQTVPFQPYPVVHCDIGLRRWAGGSDVRLPRRDNTSVYLLTRVPWINGLHYSDCFQVAPMKWERIPDTTGSEAGRDYRAAWADHLASTLNSLHPQRPFPDAEELRQQPSYLLRPDADPAAAIAYRNGMRPPHIVQAGIPAADRRELLEQLAALLAPEFVLTEPPNRCAARIMTAGSNPFFAATGEGIPTDTALAIRRQRREAIRSGVGDRITVELRCSSSDVELALTSAVRDAVGLQEADRFPYLCADTGLHVELVSERLGAIGDVLDVPTENRASVAQLHPAIRKRCQEVVTQVPAATKPTLTLIELSSKDSYQGLSDPKGALRKGFALTGRHTQFINPVSDEGSSLGHRARSSILDGLRQMGVQPTFSLDAGARLPKRIDYVGLWLIRSYAGSSATRMRERLPVAVHIEGRTGRVRAIAGGMETWLSYPDVLLRIARGDARGVGRDEEALPFIQQLLLRDLQQRDTLILCRAQNLRRAWSWLCDPRMTIDHLAFTDGERPQPIRRWQGLRILRVRDGEGHETPEYFAPNPDGAASFTSGLFRVSERVFAAVNRKPAQVQLSRHMSKLSPWQNRDGIDVPPSTRQHAWNAGFCELTAVCLQDGDSPEEWAALAQALRQAAGHHPEATTLPLPLHLAAQMEEYVLPLPDEGE
jgi:argonaute-like protein/RNase H domain-containing protein/MID domain-containing protein